VTLIGPFPARRCEDRNLAAVRCAAARLSLTVRPGLLAAEAIRFSSPALPAKANAARRPAPLGVDETRCAAARRRWSVPKKLGSGGGGPNMAHTAWAPFHIKPFGPALHSRAFSAATSARGAGRTPATGAIGWRSPSGGRRRHGSARIMRKKLDGRFRKISRAGPTIRSTRVAIGLHCRPRWRPRPCWRRRLEAGAVLWGRRGDTFSARNFFSTAHGGRGTVEKNGRAREVLPRPDTCATWISVVCRRPNSRREIRWQIVPDGFDAVQLKPYACLRPGCLWGRVSDGRLALPKRARAQDLGAKAGLLVGSQASNDLTEAPSALGPWPLLARPIFSCSPLRMIRTALWVGRTTPIEIVGLRLEMGLGGDWVSRRSYCVGPRIQGPQHRQRTAQANGGPKNTPSKRAEPNRALITLPSKNRVGRILYSIQGLFPQFPIKISAHPLVSRAKTFDRRCRGPRIPAPPSVRNQFQGLHRPCQDLTSGHWAVSREKNSTGI